jgi:thioredoxin
MNCMSTITLSEESFRATVEGSGIVLVDFWAAWCGPCRMFAPVFEEASGRYPEVVFAKVDTQAEQALAGGLGIRSIPTLMIFREGVLLFDQSGALSAGALDDLIGQAQRLDMNTVHAEIAQQETQREAQQEAQPETVPGR